jgi:hypothetical protein
LGVGFVSYLYYALCLYFMAQRAGTGNGWFAFIPILNVILLLQIADKPVWWILLFCIPLVNLVIAALVWMGAAEATGKASWLGLLMFIPGVNLVVLGYLAFA